MSTNRDPLQLSSLTNFLPSQVMIFNFFVLTTCIFDMLLIFVFTNNNFQFVKNHTLANHSDDISLSFNNDYHLTDFHVYNMSKVLYFKTAEIHSFEMKRISSFENNSFFAKPRDANQKKLVFLLFFLLLFFWLNRSKLMNLILCEV